MAYAKWWKLVHSCMKTRLDGGSVEPYIPYIYMPINEDDRAGLKPVCTLIEIEEHIRALDRTVGTFADAIGAQGAFNMESNRKLSTQYSVYKESLTEVQADALAWKLFQEVLPGEVYLFTVRVNGTAEPNAAQWTLIDKYFDNYRKNGNGTLANHGSPNVEISVGLEEIIKRVVETTNTNGVKVGDKVPTHRMQINQLSTGRAPNNQRGPCLPQPSHFQGGQQGGDGRGRPFGEWRRCYVCDRVGHLARD